MRIELVIMAIAGLVAANIYTEGRYLKLVMHYKKYWQIAGVAFGGMVLCWMLRGDPAKTKDMLETTQSYLKYMPLDSQTSSILNPILDFTTKRVYSSGGGGGGAQRPVVALDGLSDIPTGSMDGGSSGQRFKRSVSETKKKFVAARQKWMCKECGTMLTATYEIDHIVRLDRGGSNHVDNLAALCPNCHRQKTMVENL